MNVFSRVKKAVVGMFGGRLKKHGEQPTVTERRNGKLNFNAPRSVKVWRREDGKPIFGPAIQAERAGHHITRQTCRYYLRARFFAGVSQGNPLMSRRDRRRYSRVLAALEYRRMMTDDTNAVIGEDYYTRKSTHADLAATA